METTTLTPQEKKEILLAQLEKSIIDSLSDSLTTARTTASCAPSFGWSVEEYMYMPIVAARLREKGYSVSSKVNHEVTDWIIAV